MEGLPESCVLLVQDCYRVDALSVIQLTVLKH